MSNKEITAAAIRLSPRHRARLAEKLLDSLNEDAERTIDAAWAQLAESRIADLDAGRSNTKPLSKVLRRLKGRRRNAN